MTKDDTLEMDRAALIARIDTLTAERDEAKRAIVGQRARWGGVVWKVVGINYLGTFDLERFEDRPDGRYKMGGSCVFGLPRNHPHFAELIDAEAELAAAHQRAEDAARFEREAVVKWLKQRADDQEDRGDDIAIRLSADAIERGEHEKGGGDAQSE